MRSAWKPRPVPVLRPLTVAWSSPAGRAGSTDRLRLYDGRRVITLQDRPALVGLPLGSLVTTRRLGSAVHQQRSARKGR